MSNFLLLMKIGLVCLWHSITYPFVSCWRWGCDTLFYEEYSASFQGSEAEHLKALASKFFQRGRMFFGVSLALLVACFICVGFGVAAFLFPTYLTDVDAKNDRLKEIQKTVEDNVEKQRTIEKQVKFDEEFKDALAPLRSFYEHIETKTNAYARNPASVTPYEPPGTFNNTLLPYLKALQSGQETHTLTFKGNLFANDGPQVIGKEVLQKVSKLIENRQSPVSTFVSQLEQIKRAENEDSVKATMERLNELKSELQWTKEEFSSALTRLTSSYETQSEFLDAKYDLQSEIAMLGLEGAKLITEQVLEEERSAWERWLPILSIRVGVVILFLFLTRILLETYRYTTALSAFYRARGDALQMLGEGTKDKPLDSDQYAKLLIALAPENYRIDKIDSPENNLLAILRPDLSLIGKQNN